MQPKMHSYFYFRFDLGGLLFELFDFFVGFDSFFREFFADDRWGGRAWERSWADFEVALLFRDGSLAPPFSGSRRSRGCSRSRLFSLIFCFSPNCRILEKKLISVNFLRTKKIHCKKNLYLDYLWILSFSILDEI